MLRAPAGRPVTAGFEDETLFCWVSLSRSASSLSSEEEYPARNAAFAFSFVSFLWASLFKTLEAKLEETIKWKHLI